MGKKHAIASLENMGNIKRALKRLSPPIDDTLKEAFEHCFEAIRLKPSYDKAHNHLGVMLRDLEMDGLATSEFCIALSCNPNYAEAHYNLGVAFVCQQKMSAAEFEFRESIRLKPDYAEPYSCLGLILQDKVGGSFRKAPWMQGEPADVKKVR